MIGLRKNMFFENNVKKKKETNSNCQNRKIIETKRKLIQNQSNTKYVFCESNQYNTGESISLI